MPSKLTDRIAQLEARTHTDRTSGHGCEIVIVEDGETAEEAAARGYREHGRDVHLILVEGVDGHRAAGV